MITEPGAPERRLAFKVHDDVPWLVLAPGIPAELLLNVPRCRLPGARPHAGSAVNLRGVVYPVFDLARFLDLQVHSELRPLLIGTGQQAACIEIKGEPRVGLWTQESSTDGVGELGPESMHEFALAHGAIDDMPAILLDHRAWFHAAGGTAVNSGGANTIR